MDSLCVNLCSLCNVFPDGFVKRIIKEKVTKISTHKHKTMSVYMLK